MFSRLKGPTDKKALRDDWRNQSSLHRDFKSHSGRSLTLRIWCLEKYIFYNRLTDNNFRKNHLYYWIERREKRNYKVFSDWRLKTICVLYKFCALEQKLFLYPCSLGPVYNTTFAWNAVIRSIIYRTESTRWSSKEPSKEPNRYIRECSFKDISQNVFHYVWAYSTVIVLFGYSRIVYSGYVIFEGGGSLVRNIPFQLFTSSLFFAWHDRRVRQTVYETGHVTWEDSLDPKVSDCASVKCELPV